jgi:hypothetical protein
MSDNLIRVVGIDPGSTTGIICLALPTGSRDLSRAELVGSASVIRHPPRKRETIAETWARFQLDVFKALMSFVPFALAVVEEPSDGMVGGWNKTGRRGSGQATKFALGASFGTIISAIDSLMCHPRIVSYLVAGSKKREGWMPKVRTGNLTHTIKSEVLQELLRAEVDAISRRTERNGSNNLQKVEITGGPTVDELMAFGVLRHHIITRGIDGD